MQHKCLLTKVKSEFLWQTQHCFIILLTRMNKLYTESVTIIKYSINIFLRNQFCNKIKYKTEHLKHVKPN